MACTGLAGMSFTGMTAGHILPGTTAHTEVRPPGTFSTGAAAHTEVRPPGRFPKARRRTRRCALPALSHGHDGAHGGAPSRAFPQGALAAKATEDKDARPSPATSAARFSWPASHASPSSLARISSPTNH